MYILMHNEIKYNMGPVLQKNMFEYAYFFNDVFHSHQYMIHRKTNDVLERNYPVFNDLE